jgi:hypothetical protein
MGMEDLETQDIVTRTPRMKKLMHYVLLVGSTPRCSPLGGYSARDRVLDP